MRLEKIREESSYYSQKTSETIQYLAFSGIAIIWLFKIASGETIQFSILLFIAFIIFLICILVGIIQYSILTTVWSSHYRDNYNKLKNKLAQPDDTDVEMPDKFNNLVWFLFFTKLVLLIAGYTIIFIDVYKYLIIK